MWNLRGSKTRSQLRERLMKWWIKVYRLIFKTWISKDQATIATTCSAKCLMIWAHKEYNSKDQ
jgi:hypothetical protein